MAETRRSLAKQLGPMTPNKAASITLLFAGIAALLAAKLVSGIDGSFWAGIGLIALGLSFLVDGLLPGGSQFTDEQVAMMRRAGLPDMAGAAKILDLVVGVPLLLGGFYLIA
ncbi:MAG TPA: hypothetical protein VNT25_07140 [Allosphingosinicella sp.]|nr:hypothetical protein [Allosphingosinicella sp.]